MVLIYIIYIFSYTVFLLALSWLLSCLCPLSPVQLHKCLPPVSMFSCLKVVRITVVQSVQFVELDVYLDNCWKINCNDH